jgi:hypothetical protein
MKDQGVSGRSPFSVARRIGSWQRIHAASSFFVGRPIQRPAVYRRTRAHGLSWRPATGASRRRWFSPPGRTASSGAPCATSVILSAVHRRDNFERLYDNREDPGQMRNLVGKPGHAVRLEDFRRRLATRLVAIEDTFEACTWYRDHWTQDRIILRGARG